MQVLLYAGTNFFIAAPRAVSLYNMGRWHFLKAVIIHVRRLLASGQSIISRLSARASMPHERLQRDLSITQIYDLSSSHSLRLAPSRRSLPRPPTLSSARFARILAQQRLLIRREGFVYSPERANNFLSKSVFNCDRLHYR